MSVFECAIRLVLAMLVGAVIGFEREVNGHTAGFRTHIIVCIGSALVMITGYWILADGKGSDVGRFAAQVISGIGFLGAGAIIKNKSNVKGLTTAACLWTTSGLGLAIGAGAYAAAGIAAGLFMITLHFLKILEKKLLAKDSKYAVEVIFEQEDTKNAERVMESVKAQKLDISDWSYSSKKEVRFTGKIASKMSVEHFIHTLMQLENVESVQTKQLE